MHVHAHVHVCLYEHCVQRTTLKQADGLGCFSLEIKVRTYPLINGGGAHFCWSTTLIKVISPHPSPTLLAAHKSSSLC